MKTRPSLSGAGQVGGAGVLLGDGLGEHGHALVGPAGDLLLREEVGQDDVGDLVRQDRLEHLGMVGPEVDAPGGDAGAAHAHGREAGRALRLAGHLGELPGRGIEVDLAPGVPRGPRRRRSPPLGLLGTDGFRGLAGLLGQAGVGVVDAEVRGLPDVPGRGCRGRRGIRARPSAGACAAARASVVTGSGQSTGSTSGALAWGRPASASGGASAAAGSDGRPSDSSPG